MARPNKIWYRKDRKTYFVTIDGKLHNLGKIKKEAEKKYHELMAQIEQNEPAETISAAELMDKFLLWCKDNRAARTFDWYTAHLQTFLDYLPNQRIQASEIKPLHVYEAAKKTWSASYKRGFMIAVQRAFTWGVKHGYIRQSPLQHLEKPTPTRRDNCPTESEFQDVLSHANLRFRRLLQFCWETGCRPQEAFQLQFHHVKGDRIEFSVDESKGKRSKRIIYLTEKAASLIDQGSGYVFLNSKGNPWNRHSVGCQMGRIKKLTGKRFSLYDLRHAFATRMLEAGLDHLTVAKLLGHSNSTNMISRVYSHLGERNDFLLNQLRKVS